MQIVQGLAVVFSAVFNVSERIMPRFILDIPIIF